MKPFVKTLAATLLAASTAGIATVQASSHGGADADEVVQTRKDIMAGIGGDMAVLVGVVKGELVLSEKVIKRTLRGMHYLGHASKDAFREQVSGSNVKTTATADVWAQWDKFEGGLEKMNRRIAAAREAVGSDAFGPAMKDVGETCKNCHDK